VVYKTVHSDCQEVFQKVGVYRLLLWSRSYQIPKQTFVQRIGTSCTFLAKEHSFSEYYFFDKDKGKCEELEKRIDRLKHELSLPKDIIIHKPEPLSFEDASIKLFGRDGTINKKSMCLILIDPEDIKFTTWDRIESILMYGKVDLILIVMRFGLALNHSIAKKDANSPIAETMNKFFGDENWNNLKNGEELISYYRHKIQGLGYNIYRYKTHGAKYYVQRNLRLSK
jgi:three-Cys-motif partner protein